MKIQIYIICFLLFSLFIGCGGSSIDTQNYQDPTFGTYKINKIAVLPIRNTYLNIGEANKINRYFMTQLSRKTTKYDFVGPEDAVEQLAKDTLVEKYFDYLVQYATTGIPNREIIKEVAQSLGVDAIVQGEIFNIKKQDGIYGVRKGETSCNLRYSLIAGIDGKLLWETTVEASETTDFTTSGAPPLMDVVMEAMDEIIQSVPTK